MLVVEARQVGNQRRWLMVRFCVLTAHQWMLHSGAAKNKERMGTWRRRTIRKKASRK